jgi:hypothetical protein
MATIPYALSITHFVNSVGAKAGFAAIIGLALLVLLFFTQSRETANLRRRADEAEQQLYQLQLYVDHLSRSRSQPAAAPAPAAAQTTGAPVAAPPAAALAARAAASRTIPGEPAEEGGVATIPAAPAGVAAPALSSATRLIPLGEPDEISIRALRPSTNGGSHGEGAANGTAVTPPPAPPPSTAAGGGNGVARTPAPVPMPAVASGAAEPAPPPRMALPRQRQPMPQPPRRTGRGPSASGRRLNPVFFVLAGVLAAAVIAVVLIFVTGSSNGGSAGATSQSRASASSTAAGRTATSGKRHKTAFATVTPSSVTVAVLNGTSTNHLAATVLGKLTSAGYHGTNTQNASETSLTSTIVGYTAPSYRADALAVAKSLNLGPASVQAVSQADRAKVCGGTPSCSTQVVVTAGSDLAQTG